MRPEINPITRSLLSAGLMTITLGAPVGYAASPCSPCSAKPRNARSAPNPCAAKNPCAARNPCGAKNPCGPCGASGKVNPKLVTRQKNSKPAYKGNQAELAGAGESLWKDVKLSTNGMSCNTCHTNNASFSPDFAKPYPHTVGMAADRAGLKRVTAEDMVQFCMVVPMAAKPLPWDSKQLAALTAYTLQVQKSFKPNPCAAKNPCAARNPCSGRNPCAAKRK